MVSWPQEAGMRLHFISVAMEEPKPLANWTCWAETWSKHDVPGIEIADRGIGPADTWYNQIHRSHRLWSISEIHG